jgi:hypothetical protein
MTFWKQGGRFAATMMLALAVASCEHAESPLDVGAPEAQVGPQDGLLDGLLGGLTGTVTTVRAIDQYGTIRTYTLVQEPLLTNVVGTLLNTVDGLLSVVTRLIGLNGGSLANLGHSVVVPANAVDQPTTFSLGVLLNGTTTVDLSAYAPGGSGRIDVGAAGFNRPVRADITYRRGSNIRDERRLVVLRLNPAGMGALHEVIPATIDRNNNKATVWLEHFSKYCMAM